MPFGAAECRGRPASREILVDPASRGNVIPTYVTLAHFTELGLRDIKNAPKSAEAFKAAAKQMGSTAKEILYTQGAI